MTTTSIVVHPFIVKMKIPFFVLGGVLLLLQLAVILVRAFMLTNFYVVASKYHEHCRQKCAPLQQGINFYDQIAFLMAFSGTNFALAIWKLKLFIDYFGGIKASISQLALFMEIISNARKLTF
jgi:hypothetical protein